MDKTKVQETPVAKKPDENTGVLIQDKIKIFDPKSGKVYVNGRA